MDFLLLLGHGVRVVVEVDGKHHFANGDAASPSRYAEMAREDRRLRLQGYEVYRFGAAEFLDVQRNKDRYVIGPESKALVVNFFERLFARHGEQHK
jgi:very-short-patch-repair endonuclease